MALPKKGEKILVLKECWLDLILKKQKTLDIRGRAFKAGFYWLGYGGFIRGKATLGEAIPIRTEEVWALLRDQHCVEIDELPYKKTWGLPIVNAQAVAPVKYHHTRGAVGIVKYR